jgi:hypothetical protein
MKRTYEIRSSGYVLWTYKTWLGLFKRLRYLAQHSALATVAVVVFENGEPEAVPVEFVRGQYGFGWQSPVGRGIRHGEVGCMSAWSRSGSTVKWSGR